MVLRFLACFCLAFAVVAFGGPDARAQGEHSAGVKSQASIAAPCSGHAALSAAESAPSQQYEPAVQVPPERSTADGPVWRNAPQDCSASACCNHSCCDVYCPQFSIFPKLNFDIGARHASRAMHIAKARALPEAIAGKLKRPPRA